MKIESEQTNQLTARALGIWPQNVAQPPTGDASLLTRALNVEYQLETLLQQLETSPYEPLGEKSTQGVETLYADIVSMVQVCLDGTVERLVASVNAGHLAILTNRIDEAQTYLFKDTLIANVPSELLAGYYYKRALLSSHAYSLSQSAIRGQERLIAGVNVSPTLPTASNIEATYWLHEIFNRIAQLNPTAGVSELTSMFKYPNFILASINHTSKTISYTKAEVEAFITARSERLLETVTFPRADELNSQELEEFVDLVTQCPFVSASRYAPLVERAIAKTYQSHIILRSYIRVLLQSGNDHEVKAAIEVYEEYVQAYYEQNGHTYPDIISIMQTYDLILKEFSGKTDLKTLSSQEYEYWLTQIKKLRGLLDEFYAHHGVEKFSGDISNLKAESLSINLSTLSRSILAELWRTLGQVTFLIHHSTHSIYSEDKAIVEGVLDDFKHSIHLVPHDVDTFLDYAKAAADLRKVKEAYRVVRMALQTLSNTSLAYFESWHLLALILSVEENKDEAYKVISFINGEVTELLEQETTIPRSFKTAFLQIKITQLAIIESLFGIEQALDSLPELFQLFHQLFKDDIIGNEIVATDASEKTHKKSLSLARSQTLSKIKSTLSHKHASHAHSTTKHPPPFTINPTATYTKAVLQKIWILTSSIYSKLSLYSEAEQALVEAESVGGPTSETHATLALLSAKTRPKLALKEYESALATDRSSVLAVVGFAALILSNADMEASELFISKKDKFAAVARAKILLETVSDTLEGAYTTEVWWLLSQIYGKFEDDREKQALWRSVELEETRPVRAFECVYSFIH